MYISNSKKFLFIAIPKTGCSSIQYMISNSEFGKNESNTFIWNHKIPEVYHATLENIIQNIDTIESLGFSVLDIKPNSFTDFEQFSDYYYSYGNHLQVQLIKDYVKVAFVRNPWDRFVSTYLDLKHHIPPHGNTKRYSPFVPYEQVPECYKSFNFKDFRQFCKSFQTSGWNNDRHLKPQIDFITINNTIAVDKIGKFENLTKDTNMIFSDLGVDTNTIPHIHKRDRTSYRDYYDEETKNIVQEFYKEDISEFGYEF